MIGLEIQIGIESNAIGGAVIPAGGSDLVDTELTPNFLNDTEVTPNLLEDTE